MKYVKAASLCVLVLMVAGTVVLAEEKPVWTVGDKGSQGFWHCWPDKLYLDEIRFPCRVIKDTESGFTFSPYNVFTNLINKDRVGATGGSAGGATTLWLALHDDLADPESDDPVARESTRLLAAALGQAQTSLDPRQMREWIPGITYGAHAFGIQRMEDREAQFQAFLAARDGLLAKGWIQQYSPYELVSADDSPIFQNYAGRGIDEKPGEAGWKTHSPLFGVGLKKRLDELGVENYLAYDGKPARTYGNPVEFFIAKLKPSN